MIKRFLLIVTLFSICFTMPLEREAKNWARGLGAGSGDEIECSFYSDEEFEGFELADCFFTDSRGSVHQHFFAYNPDWGAWGDWGAGNTDFSLYNYDGTDYYHFVNEDFTH